MGMYRQADVFRTGTHLEGQHRFMNQFPGVLTADTRTDNAAGFFIKKGFGHSRGCPGTQCPTTGPPREFSFVKINILLLLPLFR